MSLANSHTFVALESVTAANLNGVITNILNNPISLVSPTTGAINFASQAHTGLLYSAITPSAPRLLQTVGTMTTGANITSTTPTTIASQAITPSSTTSRIKVLFSCDASAIASAGAQQGVSLQIATSSGTISNTTRGLTIGGTVALGVEACPSWSFIHQSTGPYPLTYAIQAFAATSTAASPYGTATNVNLMLEELSS